MNIDNKKYKFKPWEKIFISILTPLILFFSAPLTILFMIIFAIVIVKVLGFIGFIFLGIFIFLLYLIVKYSIDD
ncbi:MAG: hypothetical protein KA384_02900 [Leptotrichiaceae bacterium]|nr:hypothetical protein [Leptotrichiaceae bacterium]MBP7739185.1 hypothetical protein [Leptotrichiaceae bacterium]MBP9629661.1 hypothetical protein [Leptotrichiaceae bacterium]